MSVAPIFYTSLKNKVFRGIFSYDEMVDHAQKINLHHFVMYGALGGLPEKGGQRYYLVSNDEDVQKLIELSKTEGILRWISVSEETYQKIQSDPTGDIFWKPLKDTPLHFPICASVFGEKSNANEKEIAPIRKSFYLRLASGVIGAGLSYV
jgi:hypothetical protein